MSFQDKLEAHYQQTEAAETEAREIEGRIKQIAGAELSCQNGTTVGHSIEMPLQEI